MSQYNVQLQDGNGPLAGLRNQLINGNMFICQRETVNTSVANVTQVYTTDRWYVHIDSAQQYTWEWRDSSNANFPSSFTDQGFNYCLNVRNASASYQVRQAVELPDVGYRGQFVPGSTWTVSIYSSAVPNVKADFRTTSSGSAGDVVSILAETVMTAVAGATDRYELSFTIPNTALVATNDCLLLSFKNSVSGTSSINVTGCQLEPGPVATPFEQRPIAAETALCQRYYVAESGVDYPLCRAATTSGTANNDQNVYANIQFKPSMRTTPTVAVTVFNNPTPLTVSPHPGNFRVKVGSFNTNSSTSLTDYTADAEL